MIAISRQYPFVADKAVQVSWVVFLIKGHNSNFAMKSKIAELIRISDRLYASTFVFKHSENCNIALCSMHTQPPKSVFSHYKSMGIFSDAQGQVTHKSLIGFCQISNLSEI